MKTYLNQVLLGSGANATASRIYTKATNNPRQFVLILGKYTVKISTPGRYKAHNISFEMQVKTGEAKKSIKPFNQNQ